MRKPARLPVPGSAAILLSSRGLSKRLATDSRLRDDFVFEVDEALQVESGQAKALCGSGESHDRQHALRIPRPWRHVRRRRDQAAGRANGASVITSAVVRLRKQHRQQIAAPLLQCLRMKR